MLFAATLLHQPEQQVSLPCLSSPCFAGYLIKPCRLCCAQKWTSVFLGPKATSVPEQENFFLFLLHFCIPCMPTVLPVTVRDSPGWGGWHCFSSSNFKDTAGAISISQTNEQTVTEAMVLVLGQDPGHQLLLQRRASRALQGTQPCSHLRVLISCQTNSKEMLLLGHRGNKHVPTGSPHTSTSGAASQGGLRVPFAIWMHRWNGLTCRTQETHQHPFRDWGSFDTAPS